MVITGKHIARRTLLRGMGVSLALPLLDSMFPAFQPLARAGATPKAPRFVGLFNPHGWAPGYWEVPAAGPMAEFPFILKPLEPFRDTMTMISGLDGTSSMPPPGATGGDHSRSAAALS